MGTLISMLIPTNCFKHVKLIQAIPLNGNFKEHVDSHELFFHTSCNYPFVSLNMLMNTTCYIIPLTRLFISGNIINVSSVTGLRSVSVVRDVDLMAQGGYKYF